MEINYAIIRKDCINMGSYKDVYQITLVLYKIGGLEKCNLLSLFYLKRPKEKNIAWLNCFKMCSRHIRGQNISFTVK